MYYSAMDLLDQAAWARFKALGMTFNIVFSDAIHAYEPVMHEFNQIRKVLAMKEDFVLFYDDLDEEVM